MAHSIKSFFSGWFLIAFILVFSGCKKQTTEMDLNILEQEIFGLASPIKLNYDTTVVFLSDYFSNISVVKVITLPPGLQLLNPGSKDTLVLLSGSELDAYSLISVGTAKNNYHIPVLRSGKIKYSYNFSDPGKRYNSLALMGEMNAWNPANTQLNYANGKWTTDLYLDPDRYQYLIVIDGIQQLDPGNNEKINNGMGGWNSVLSIDRPSDAEVPVLKTGRISKDSLFLTLSDPEAGIIVLYQNHRIDHISENGQVIILLPDEARKIRRSYLRFRAFNNDYVSDEVFVPLHYRNVLNKADQLSRQDKEQNIIYFVMVDRFRDGDPSNNRPLNDPEVHPRADWHGGDIAGIIEMLEDGYFERLGVNCIYLSPIVKNPEGKFGFYDKGGVQSKFSAYHGYWPLSFTSIDKRFGTSEELKRLVNKAHRKDKNVLLDIVANHVHEQHPVYVANKHKNWATDLYLPDGSLNTERWDEHRLTTWFDVFLPTLNLELDEVAEMLSDSIIFWLEKYDIDGFRHDATKHIPLSFWRMLTQKVRKVSHNTRKSYYQVGETYGSPELIGSYIGSGLLDAQFDFNVFDAMLSSVIREETGFGILAERMKQSINYYGSFNLMANITGNQDKPRFMALASADVSFEEDSKLAGWTRTIETKTEEAFDKLALMHSLIMTMPGVPVIYYGDEIGLTGGNDPDNRRMMKFDDLDENESRLLERVSALTHLRRSNPVFLYGNTDYYIVENDILVYSRNYFGKTAVVIINTSSESREIELDSADGIDTGNLRPIFGSEDMLINGKLIINVSGLSYEVLIN